MALRLPPSVQAHRFDAATLEALDVDVDRTMASRSMPGTISYPALLLILSATSALHRNDLTLCAGFVLGMVGISAFRLWFFRLPYPTAAGPRQLWRRTFDVSGVVSAGYFATFVALALHRLPFGLISAFGVSAATAVMTGIAHAYAPRPRLQLAAAAAIVVPTLVSTLTLTHPDRFGLAALFALLLFYALFLGRRLSLDYWQSAINQAELKIRGDALERSQAQVARDVVERERMREQLVDNERLASIGTLAAGVAHEINNPLTYVLANLDHALDELRTQPDGAAAKALIEPIADARQGADRVRLIVRDLRTFSRAHDNTSSPIIVEDVVALALKMTRKQLPDGVRLVREIGPVPRVVANEAKLGQVLVNLVLNASYAVVERHGPDGGGQITVRARSGGAGSVLIEVSDNGVGIPPETVGRVFDPFFTTKPVGVGTGLGLSICHNSVRSFGGDLSVTSEVGRGTTFTIRLLATSEPQAVSTSIPVPSGASKTRILVIDDDLTVGRSLKRALGKTYDVVVENGGKEGLARLRADGHFDLILCDVLMPEVDGIQLYETLAGERPEMIARVIFMTGGVFTERARSFLEGVPNDVVDKPFELGRLRRVLERRLTAGATGVTGPHRAYEPPVRDAG